MSNLVEDGSSPDRVSRPRSVDVVAIRKRMGLSQIQFANRYGFSHTTLRDWEQGRRSPGSVARTLLTVLDREPQAVDRALQLL